MSWRARQQTRAALIKTAELGSSMQSGAGLSSYTCLMITERWRESDGALRGDRRDNFSRGVGVNHSGRAAAAAAAGGGGG